LARLTVHFTTDLGAYVSVEIAEEALLETLRRYGEMGWSSGEIPSGGLVLAGYGDGDFDWSLLGGRRLGDETVWCRGQEWQRRERQGEVLYLRLARAADPKEHRFAHEDGHEYVVLAVFPKVQEGQAVPEQAPTQVSPSTSPEEMVAEEAPVTAEKPPDVGEALAVEEAPVVDERVVKMRENMGKLLAELEEKGKRAEAQEVMDRRGYSQAETEDIDLGRQVYKELRTLLR
jgi:hypothetical protein